MAGGDKIQLQSREGDLFDINSDGTLQYKEFMAGIALLYYTDKSVQEDALIDILASDKDEETGMVYFDKNLLKSFAWSRHKKYPGKSGTSTQRFLSLLFSWRCC